ncbi:MAG: heavy metal translocating P-type ATPase [Helicobacter sp.]|uniref:heavy metal translocating P-type ATPase n=1 Tax=Helicobacter sp. TaxID=218 RepID=UPI002A90CD6F|nr:heavy metal translocating P-type ATPase [Helicobacter sp.]MDY5616589.1 heavy metal translocating P-type ATPase [Helicobacter sp.]
MTKRCCDHCRLEFDESVLIQTEIANQKKYFCCRGCEGVYRLLQTQGLEDFYSKLGDQKLEPIQENKNTDFMQYDSVSFLEHYGEKKGDFFEISLILERIHCIACVWLNEKILSQQEGIIEVHINYTNNKATILFDPTLIKVSQIIQIIQQIGYDAHFYDSRLQETYAKKEKKDYYIKMVVGIFCVMNIMWIAVAQYAGYFSGISQEMRNILNIAGFILATPVLFFSGGVFWRGAYMAFKYKSPNMDLLVISGATLAYIYSIYASFRGGETYFESVAMIITFVLIGKFLEIRGKKSAIDSLDKLNAQIPFSVMVKVGENFQEKSIESVEVGDVIQVKVGDRVALDGILLSKEALCDESALSGESLPQEKIKGQNIYSGSLALNKSFIYEVTKVFKESLMTKIVNLVEDSLNARPKIQEVANKISRYFSSVILLFALITFGLWYLVWEVSFDKSLMVMISVIIIACPCALALATPIASLVGLGEAFKQKVLFKEVRFLEVIAKANTLVVDKTGTLTEGKLRVIGLRDFGAEMSDFEILYGMVEKSSHPISVALLGYFEKSYKKAQIESVEQISARGIKAEINGKCYVGGNLELLKESGVALPKDLQESQNSVFYFAREDRLLAEFSLEDTLKKDAKESIEKIQKMGIKVILLSGDNRSVCQRVAQSLGISEYYAKQNPINKADFIDKLHKEGQVVVMAGDGINDSIAFGRSDIAIAMGSGIDVAISISDIVVLDDRVGGIAEAFRIGKRTFKFIKQNLWISLLYNAFMIPLAMLGYVIPLVAALSMSLSSLVVVGNSLRIKR